jgi:hypothetical protein
MEESMTIDRRVFFAALVFARAAQTTSHRVAVLETFGTDRAVVAVLVHHSEPATRDRFAQWLQTHPKHPIRLRTKTGEEVAATIFRVRMCFGRGLILLEKPMPILESDLLTVIASASA